MRVFLSYRRRDVGGYSGRLVDTLVQRLGEKNVFYDVSTIALGEDFAVSIDRALADCDAMLAVIGPGWLTAATPEGTPRLAQPDDYVRRELSRALDSDVPVVPVLVGGATLPTAADLPAELARLVHRQGIELHDETWHEDVEGLLRTLRGQPAAPPARPPGRRRLIVGGVVVALLAVSGGAWLWSGNRDTTGGSDNGADSGSAADPPACTAPAPGVSTAIPLADGAAGTFTYAGGPHLTVRVADASWRPLAAGTWFVTLGTTLEHDGAQDASDGHWLYDYLAVGRRSFEVSCFLAVPYLVAPGLVGDAVVGFEVTCEPVGAMSLTVGAQTATVDFTAANDPGPC